VPSAAGARLYAAVDLPLGPAAVTGVDPTGATTADGRRHPALSSGRATWFSWFADHPGTDWWPR
jgi:hypothetical protein